MNKFGLTDTSILNAIQPGDTIPYLVVKVIEVQGQREEEVPNSGDPVELYLKSALVANEDGVIILIEAWEDRIPWIHNLSVGEVIAMKNVFTKRSNCYTQGTASFYVNVLKNLDIERVEDGKIDQKEAFFMQLRYGTSAELLGKLMSDYPQLLKAESESESESESKSD